MSASRPPKRRDAKRPRDTRPRPKPKPSPLSTAAVDHARQLADDAPPFSPEVRARLAVVLAPMGQHLAAHLPPARVRAA